MEQELLNAVHSQPYLNLKSPDHVGSKCLQVIAECHHFNRIRNIIHQDDSDKVTDDSINTISTQKILNDYLHLIQQHNTDNEFEFIYNTLKICDVSKCEIFRRNSHRIGTKTNNQTLQISTNLDEKCAARQQIIDKIHCYFKHCYDFGHRLLIEEKLKLQNYIDSEETQTVKTLMDILSTKQTFNNIDHILAAQTNKKYSQLTTQNNQLFWLNKDKMYCFGYKFKY
eukprot:229767_1